MAIAKLPFTGLAICILIINSVPISESFTLKMVRRDAIDRTLFPKNQSDLEKTQIFTDLTYSRLYNQHRLGPDAVRPRMRQFESSIFAAPTQVGSEERGGYLLIDTGSSLLWIQCEGCTNCPPLQVPRYNPATSNTYIPIAYNSPDCTTGRRYGDHCGFEIEYVTGSSSGIIGGETFTFESTEPPGIILIKLLFGCVQQMSPDLNLGRNYGEHNVLVGILGLMLDHKSFMTVSQATTKLKFSYCLPTWAKLDQNIGTDLTFGDDVPQKPPIARTIAMDPYHYRLINCVDISVAGNRLHLDPGIFRSIRPDGSGGLVIDSGSSFTLLAHDAFERVKNAFIYIFATHGIHQLPPEQHPEKLKLCFQNYFPPGFSWPSMTFHFEHADFEVAFGNMFKTTPQIACLAVYDGADYSTTTNYLGAFQQANYRFWYDLQGGTLSFTAQECPGG